MAAIDPNTAKILSAIQIARTGIKKELEAQALQLAELNQQLKMRAEEIARMRGELAIPPLFTEEETKRILDLLTPGR